MKYKIKLIAKKEVASGTMAFHFEKPGGFIFKAGQFAEFTLLNPSQTDEEGNTRAFTLVGAPYEEDIMLATRMRDSAFKRELKVMEIGTEITFEAPFGSFTLHNNTRTPAVFLTGGIGITPARSIILQAAHDNASHQIFLFYANKTPSDAAFLEELKALHLARENFTFIPSMTEMGKSTEKWNGETGFFTQELLEKYIEDLALPIYYLSGPADMVASVRKTLNEAGVDDDNIRTEEFSGY